MKTTLGYTAIVLFCVTASLTFSRNAGAEDQPASGEAIAPYISAKFCFRTLLPFPGGRVWGWTDGRCPKGSYCSVDPTSIPTGAALNACKHPKIDKYGLPIYCSVIGLCVFDQKVSGTGSSSTGD